MLLSSPSTRWGCAHTLDPSRCLERAPAPQDPSSSSAGSLLPASDRKGWQEMEEKIVDIIYNASLI